VWELFDWLLAMGGRHRPPVLIERDDNIPDFEDLLAERDRAASMMAKPGRELVDA
jgi:uncharacterized protein (UPF0276 family)